MPFNQTQDNYRRLREIVSERTRRLVVWCGSGLSIPAGLPDWSGLRRSLSIELKRKAETFKPRDRAKTEEEVHRISLERNPWIAFLRLKKALGTTSFEQVIREALRPAATAPIPNSYTWIWRLRPSGLLNLNLDKLATRAFYETYGPKALSEFDSTSVGAHTHVLKGLNPFVYNMHGTHENSPSWVLTHDDLNQLLDNEAYKNFVDTTISSSTILYVGLSVDDLAVGGHLERLVKQGIRTGPHFWISARDDRETDRWAESSGTLMIRYATPGGSHDELHELFKDLLAYVPPDEIGNAPPVVATVTIAASAPRELPEPRELARQDAEVIRELLNAKAAELLANDSAENFTRFQSLIDKYDEAIHRAWYVSTKEGANTLLNYTLQSEIAHGAFGRVFRALAPDGSAVAVKLLHNQMRDNRNLLLAFRRGVRSMSILKERGVRGVATYREGSEIPAIVVMDWIEGANLKDAVEAGRLATWEKQLRASRQLTHVISEAHATPERVLHRDIRPANVMIKDFWTTDLWSIIVLDFDLSWHRGAYEMSVIHGSSTAGYLAPEQITRRANVSARHAAVDSFGLGMTFFFSLSKRDPLPAQHLHSDWEASVVRAAQSLPPPSWKSLPRRYARLILRATQDDQAARIDVVQIGFELDRLSEALVNPRAVRAADLLAEEVAANSETMSDYTWDQDSAAARVSRPSGLMCEVRGDESRGRVVVNISWSRLGAEDRKRVARWIPETAKKAVAALRSSGWHVHQESADREAMTIEAECSVEELQKTFPKHVSGVDRGAGLLRFE